MTLALKIPEWQTKLQARGILDAALEAGWKEYEWYGKSGWAYPLHKVDGTPWLYPDGRVVQRWRNFDSGAQFRLGFHPGMPKGTKKPDGCNYYWHGVGDMTKRIANAKGILYLAAGEPDMLTLMQIGYYNVTSFFGEKNIPDGFVDHMQKLGVKRIINYPDRDKTGLEAAERIHKLLSSTSINFTAYELPPNSDGFDLNDYYNMPRPRALSFRQALVGLPPVTFAPTQKALSDAPDYEAFNRQIEAALGVDSTKYKDNGFSNPVRCLNTQHTHDDKHAAAGWHRDKHILRCFKCETKLGGDEVARLLGIEKPRRSAKVHILPPPEQQPEPPEPPPVTIDPPAPTVPVYTMSNALKRYQARLKGELIAEFTPIPFPFPPLHSFGGFAKMMKPRKMICLLGLSGGGKTSWLEGAGDNLRRNGIDILWWGPEWSDDEMADRAVQRYGGLTMTEMMLHETAISEIKHHSKAKFGTLISKGDLRFEKTLKTVGRISEWPGEYYFVDQMRLDLSVLLDVMSNQIDKQRAAGRNLRVCMFDYVQLLFDTNMNSFIATQPRKGDSESARYEAVQLVSESAKYLEPNDFALFITLTPEYKNGKMTNRGKVSLTKNNMGQTGSITVVTDLARLTWRDEIIK